MRESFMMRTEHFTPKWEWLMLIDGNCALIRTRMVWWDPRMMLNLKFDEVCSSMWYTVMTLWGLRCFNLQRMGSCAALSWNIAAVFQPGSFLRRMIVMTSWNFQFPKKISSMPSMPCLHGSGELRQLLSPAWSILVVATGHRSLTSEWHIAGEPGIAGEWISTKINKNQGERINIMFLFCIL